MIENNFKWTDELVAEFTTWSLNEAPTYQGRYSDIEQFKKMKSISEEKKYTQKELDQAIREAIKSASLELPYAIGRLVEELSKGKSEGSYYHGWQSNIAMAFIVEYVRLNPNMQDSNKEILHQVANRAATNFLDSLCYHPKPEPAQSLSSTLQPKEQEKFDGSKTKRFEMDETGQYEKKEKLPDTKDKGWQVLEYDNGESPLMAARIKKVLRTSDNTIWTVGEEVNHQLSGDPFIISRFSIEDGARLKIHKDNSDWWCAISNAKKLPAPQTSNLPVLFTTEDMRKCFWAGWAVVHGDKNDRFEEYLKANH